MGVYIASITIDHFSFGTTAGKHSGYDECFVVTFIESKHPIEIARNGSSLVSPKSSD
jgi:hypothetical protein